MSYRQFLNSKLDFGSNSGFKPVFMPDYLFDFQSSLVDWAVRKGRSALFEDCGLGKTIQQLVWAENVVRHTNKPVLGLLPLGVLHQTAAEAAKFGIVCEVSRDGKFNSSAHIVLTNYEKLQHFNPHDFSGCFCDESSILKNFDGATKEQITEFMRVIAFRLLCTATAAPNDYIELGTSSECLGEMGYMDMLSRFFKTTNGEGSAHGGGGGVFGSRNKSNLFGAKFRFRGHAERDFWRWVCSWARAVRKPSDLGFEDGAFILPPLETFQHVVNSDAAFGETLFPMAAVTLQEQRAERRQTLERRCKMAAEIVSKTSGAFICWCSLNDEGDLLENLIPDAVQVSGDDSDEKKEELYRAFESGQSRGIITKPQIAGFGMNWQHCSHQTIFPSHSFEQYYQCVRRSWRFGQKNKVRIDVITSESESRVLSNLQRKERAALEMFDQLVAMMNQELNIKPVNKFTTKEQIPSWL